jgi:transcriptional regulator with XRE-family HTH domain
VRAAGQARSKLIDDIERLRADAGIPLETLAGAAGVPASYLRRIMAGRARPSIETYAKIAMPLGADLATRLYPNTGPLIRDRHQARIVEALLARLHSRWHATTEVAVRQPARGWIDVVLSEPHGDQVVAVEVESDIRRIEQMVRWAKAKADSLRSSDLWSSDAEPRISQLLIVRLTRSTRLTAAAFAVQLGLAYPAHPQDAMSALTGTTPWPGSALVLARIDGDRVRFLPSRT